MGTTEFSKIFDIKTELDNVLQDIESKTEDKENTLKVLDKLTIDTKNWDFSQIDTKGFDLTFEELHDLILCGKQIITHVENTIITTDVIDPEILGGLGKLIEATHLILTEYITIYRDKIQFANKIKLALLQQEHKKELLKLKHDLDLDKLDKIKKDNSINTEGTVTYDQTSIIKMMDEIDTDNESLGN